MIDLIKVRKKLKSKKPTFLRQDGHKLHLPQKWVRPRGIHNKMRLKLKGHRVRPSTGFRSPKKVRNTLSSGLFPIMIQTKKSLDLLNTKTQAAILSSTVGKKKKLEILEYAISKNIIIYNIKDPKSVIEKIKQEVQNRKKQTISTQEKKKISKEESLKKAQQKQQEQDTKELPQEQKQEDIKLEKEALEKQHVHEHAPKIEQQQVSSKIAKKDNVRTKIPAGGDRSSQKQ